MHRFLGFLGGGAWQHAPFLRGWSPFLRGWPPLHALVGRSILYHWPAIGWYPGVLQRRQMDGRVKRGGQTCNFYVNFEVDDDEVPSALSLDDYDAEGEGGWVLLEPVAGEAGEE